VINIEPYSTFYGPLRKHIKSEILNFLILGPYYVEWIYSASDESSDGEALCARTACNWLVVVLYVLSAIGVYIVVKLGERQAARVEGRR